MQDHAVIVLRNDRNEVLFVKRALTKKTLPGAWSFPSGTREEGESPAQTVVREAMEELGVIVEPKGIMATTELPEFSVRLIFVNCSLKQGQPSIREPKEIDSLRWQTFQEFFDTFSDSQIGHGLIWLRQNKQLWHLNS